MAVTTDMIATALGVAAPASGSLVEAQWEMWIADAEFLIEERRIEQGAEPISEAKLDYVIKEAVVAHARKPDDSTTITIAVDDATSTRRYESSKGRVSLDDWWKFLGLFTEVDGAFTIRPVGREPDGGVPEW